MEQFIHLNTACGPIKGLDKGAHAEFLGVKFANAGRFEYAIPVTNFKKAIADPRMVVRRFAVPRA